MPDKPNAAEPQTPRRRWSQFRLRTLLTGVALLAIPLAFVSFRVKAEMELMAEREAVLAEILRLGGSYDEYPPPEYLSGDPYLSRVRVNLDSFDIPVDTPRQIIRRIRSAFPDTTLIGFTAPTSDGWGGRSILIPAYDDKR